MTNSRRLRFLPLLLVAACGGETTIVQVQVASVTVSPSAASVQVGLSVQFTASALDASGSPVTGQAVTWESSVTGVATVDADGSATGVAPGTSQIRATIGGVTGFQTLTVEAPTCTSPTDVTLSPGQFAVFPGDDCLRLPAGAPGDMYRVVLTRPTLVRNETNVDTVTLSISPLLTPAAGAAEPSTAPSASAPREQLRGLIDGTRALEHLRWQAATRAFHNELRQRERDLGLPRSARLPNRAGPARAPVAWVDPPTTDSMFLGLSCSDTSEDEVTLIDFSDNIALYQETAAYDTAAISAAAAAELIGYYDTYVHGMVHDYWGPIPDTDADARVTVVTTPNLGENVAAAVFSGDFYQQNNGCAASNEGETIYFQGDLLLALDDGVDTDYFALGVVAHEMKHVVSLYNSIERIDGDFNELWIEEGTAEVSQVMSSRIAWEATGGPPLGHPIDRDDILAAVTANGGSPTKEMTGIIDALAGVVRSLSANPNSVTVDPDGAPAGHSFYSTSWNWHRLLGDAFGDASTPLADTTFFRMLTDADTPAGLARGEILLTGRGSFEQLFEDFAVAVAFHGTGHTPAYAFDTWDFVSAGSVFRNPNPAGDYPWPVTATETTDPSGNVVSSQQWAPFSSDAFTTVMGPAGIRFHDFRSSGTAGAQIAVTGLIQPCDADNTVRCDRIIVARID